MKTHYCVLNWWYFCLSEPVRLEWKVFFLDVLLINILFFDVPFSASTWNKFWNKFYVGPQSYKNSETLKSRINKTLVYKRKKYIYPIYRKLRCRVQLIPLSMITASLPFKFESEVLSESNCIMKTEIGWLE